MINKYKKSKIKTTEEIPTEVMLVKIIQHFNISVGSFIAKQCKETINKYPEYFKD